MKTNFENTNQLKNGIEIGQKLYIENHLKPEMSRVTKVRNKQSYFFTVESKEGKESWIINGATNFKQIGLKFNKDSESVDLYFKKDNLPYLTIYFNEDVIKTKETQQ